MIRPIGYTLAIGALGLVLTGCVQAQENLQADFGAAVRQTVAAQTADPDAHYKRVEQPASSGTRTSLAQDRYNKGKVLQPAQTNTSTAVSGGGGEGKQ